MVGPSDLSTRTAQAIECLGGAISLGPPPLIEGEDGTANNQLHGRICSRRLSLRTSSRKSGRAILLTCLGKFCAFAVSKASC
jgi:hypothetical protein